MRVGVGGLWGGKEARRGGAHVKTIVAPTMPRLDDCGVVWVDCGRVALKNAPSLFTGRVGEVDWAQLPRVWCVGGLGRCVPVRGSGALYPNYNDIKYNFGRLTSKNRHLDYVCRYVLPTFSPVRMLVGMLFLSVIRICRNILHLTATHYGIA